MSTTLFAIAGGLLIVWSLWHWWIQMGLLGRAPCIDKVVDAIYRGRGDIPEVKTVLASLDHIRNLALLQAVAQSLLWVNVGARKLAAVCAVLLGFAGALIALATYAIKKVCS